MASDIETYVKSCVAAGMKRDTIEGYLASSGWKKEAYASVLDANFKPADKTKPVEKIGAAEKSPMAAAPSGVSQHFLALKKERNCFNIIEALFWIRENVFDTGLLFWSAVGVILNFILYFAFFLGGGVLISILGVLAIPFVLVVVPLVWLLLADFPAMKVIQAAMRINNIPVAQGVSFVDWYVFTLRRLLADLTCWYDKKLLIPALIALVLAAVLAINAFLSLPKGAAGALALLFILPSLMIPLYLVLGLYEIVVLIHSTRTKLSPFLFMRGDAKKEDAAGVSHGVLKGQTLEVLMPNAIQYIMLSLLLYIVVIPLYLVFIIASIATPGLMGSPLLLIIPVAAIALVCITFVIASFALLESALFLFFTSDRALKMKS